jgi:hypothetical protein
MPKLAPKSVIVAASLKGAEGEGTPATVTVPKIDVIDGAEYKTPDAREPVRCVEPQETTPGLTTPIPPRRPCGSLTSTEESDIQRLLLVEVDPILVFDVKKLPSAEPRT